MHLWMASSPMAPNPRRVAITCRLKGITIPETAIDLFKGEQKSPEVLAINPRGQVPALQLDDGRVLSETVAICRYLDELYPEPPLFGSDAFERAETDMWTRRAENILGAPVAGAWVHGHEITAKMFPQVRLYGEACRVTAGTAMDWFDGQLQGRQFLCGDRFTIADIVMLTTIDFAAFIGLAIGDARPALTAWHGQTTARCA